jgi:hypothetical protein
MLLKADSHKPKQEHQIEFQTIFSVEIDEPEILRVTKKDVPAPKGTYRDLHVYEVTCLQLGKTKVTFVVGNNPSATNT